MRFGYVGGSPRARLFLDSKRAGKRMADVRTPFGAQGVILAQVRKLAGKLNFDRTAVEGRAGRVALKPLYDFVMRGGREWALEPGRYRGVGLRVEAAHVRICSDARTTKAGIAAVALLRNEFVVELRGPAYEVLLKALQVTNEIYGSESSATVAAIRALGDELRGMASIVLSDKMRQLEPRYRYRPGPPLSWQR